MQANTSRRRRRRLSPNCVRPQKLGRAVSRTAKKITHSHTHTSRTYESRNFRLPALRTSRRHANARICKRGYGLKLLAPSPTQAHPHSTTPPPSFPPSNGVPSLRRRPQRSLQRFGAVELQSKRHGGSNQIINRAEHVGLPLVLLLLSHVTGGTAMRVAVAASFAYLTQISNDV